MPDQQTQTDRSKPKRRRSKASRRRARKRAVAEKAATPEGLASFSLLADPVAIAGGRAPEMPPAHAEGATAEAPPAHAEGATAEAPPADAEEATAQALPTRMEADGAGAPRPLAPKPHRIDATTARRLAAEARERERASREALEATRQALCQRPSRRSDARPGGPDAGWPEIATDVADAPPDETDEAPRQTIATRRENREASRRSDPTPAQASATAARQSGDDRSGWTRRALAGRQSERLAREATAGSATQRDAGSPSPDADDREVAATLAIARETTLGQKREIAALREKLAAREARIAELQHPHHDLETLRRENAQALADLRERLERSERERSQAEIAREQLERALEERQAIIDARGARIEALHDRLAAQDRALEAARCEFTLERERHTRTRELLARLRETLLREIPEVETTSFDAKAPSGECPAEARPRDDGIGEDTPPAGTAARSSSSAVHPGHGAAATVGSEAIPEPEARPCEASTAAKRFASPDPRAPAPAPGRRPAVFAAWLDDQVRRRFGPMGFDRLADLLETPLARRARPEQSQSIVLIGHGVWHQAASLAEALIETTPGGFTLHVVDPRGEPRTPTIGFDSPLRDFVEAAEAPASPDDLARLLDRLAPAAIVSHDFLTHLESPDAWIDVLEAECHRACLLFVEGTGLGAIEAPEPMRTIGDRIWELMPERYTRVPGTERRLDSWLEAFHARDAAPTNALSERLRERFRFELSAQFGFLSTPFLCSPIAANFDPDAARDRRFLAQVADLDDRKIEGGFAPPLHLLALVDPLADGD